MTSFFAIRTWVRSKSKSKSKSHWVPLAAASAFAVVSLAGTAQAQWPVGLPELTYPKDNPASEEKIALGRMLYFDKRLSADNSVSCASCHDPKLGWSNNDATAVGVGGRT